MNCPLPGPFSEHDLIQRWNAQADNANQWDSLDACEKLAWAQTCAIEADRSTRPAPPAPEVGEGPSEQDIAEMAENLEWRRLPWAEGTGNSFLLDL